LNNDILFINVDNNIKVIITTNLLVVVSNYIENHDDIFNKIKSHVILYYISLYSYYYIR